MRANQALCLSLADWKEIADALARALVQCCGSDAFYRRWRNQLKRIVRVVGADGGRAAMEGVRLSAEDWIEVARALARARNQLTGARANSAYYRRRRQHLDRILRAIGVDGEKAATQGVKPLAMAQLAA